MERGREGGERRQRDKRRKAGREEDLEEQEGIWRGQCHRGVCIEEKRGTERAWESRGEE